ncbi:MAG: ATP-binding protein [Pseudomonadota bacterium]
MNWLAKALTRPTTLYMLALLLIALAAIASHTVLVQSLSELDEDSLVINTSGRQRMLSEQTFRLASELVAARSVGEAEEIRAQLEASLDLMRSSHIRLAGNARPSAEGVPGELAIEAAYFDGEPSLDQRLRSYFDNLDALIATEPATLSVEQEAYRAIARSHREGLLGDLDRVVQIYEAQAQESLEASESLHVYLMLATLALLVILGMFVFRPMIERQARTAEGLRQARDEARAEVSARTNILAAVSHEIRTPLGGVLGIIDQLKRERSPVERERALNLIEDSCEALLATLDAILQQSRLDEGPERLTQKAFRPRSVANRVVELFRPLARRKALRIEVNATSDRQALGDSARIQQVLANLVSNSVKFTQSGSVTILVKEPGNGDTRWTFVVADTGSGMDQKRIDILFERFGHSADDTLGRTVGAGLGLSITRDLVEGMGGSIEVESELGRGTSFVIRVPLGVPLDDGKKQAAAKKGSVALLIDRASDRVQAEAIAVQCGYGVIDLSAPEAPDLDDAGAITIIVDAPLVETLSNEIVSASDKIVVLGEETRELDRAIADRAVAIPQSHLARSLKGLLEGQSA